MITSNKKIRIKLYIKINKWKLLYFTKEKKEKKEQKKKKVNQSHTVSYPPIRTPPSTSLWHATSKAIVEGSAWRAEEPVSAAWKAQAPPMHHQHFILKYIFIYGKRSNYPWDYIYKP